MLALSSVPEPVAGPGQALVSVTAADVVFLDTAIRSGRATAWSPVRPPFVPGAGAGEHHELAQRALALLAVGRLRPVIGQTWPLPQAAGAHAALEARTAIGKMLLTMGG